MCKILVSFCESMDWRICLLFNPRNLLTEVSSDGCELNAMDMCFFFFNFNFEIVYNSQQLQN